MLYGGDEYPCHGGVEIINIVGVFGVDGHTRGADISRPDAHIVHDAENAVYQLAAVFLGNAHADTHFHNQSGGVAAVETVDECSGCVVESAVKNGYDVVIIADHGNADNVLNPDGSPNTAHSLNPVPIIVVSDRVKSVKDGILADVAPTVLKLMGLDAPAEMTGEVLVEMK